MLRRIMNYLHENQEVIALGLTAFSGNSSQYIRIMNL